MAQVIINNTDRDSARDLLDCAGVRWREAINSTNARHYQAALDRIAQLMADSRELASIRRRALDTAGRDALMFLRSVQCGAIGRV